MSRDNNPRLKENIDIVQAIKENLIEIKNSGSNENKGTFKFLDEYLKDKEIIVLRCTSNLLNLARNQPLMQEIDICTKIQSGLLKTRKNITRAR